jgi:hypothetical protein
MPEAITAIEKTRDLKEVKGSLFFLAMAYWMQGQTELARQRFDEASEWMSKTAPNDTFLRSYRAEAARVLGLKVN